MAAPVDICNLALSHLGVSTEIANLETERSKEAAACRRFYETVRDEVLRDFTWPFATVIADLALVQEQPNAEWAYAYRYPADALFFRRILTGGCRVEQAGARVPYRIGRDADGQLIFTDQATAVAEWTTLVDDTEQWPPDCVQAAGLLLASYIAPRVTGGDQFKLGLLALQKYQARIMAAKANAANEETPDQPPDSEFITARG